MASNEPRHLTVITTPHRLLVPLLAKSIFKPGQGLIGALQDQAGAFRAIPSEVTALTRRASGFIVKWTVPDADSLIPSSHSTCFVDPGDRIAIVYTHSPIELQSSVLVPLLKCIEHKQELPTIVKIEAFAVLPASQSLLESLSNWFTESVVSNTSTPPIVLNNLVDGSTFLVVEKLSGVQVGGSDAFCLLKIAELNTVFVFHSVEEFGLSSTKTPDKEEPQEHESQNEEALDPSSASTIHTASPSVTQHFI